MLYVSLVLSLGVLLGLIYTLISVIFLAIERCRPAPEPPNTDLPPMSVFKPVKGLDEDLEGNLRSFFEQQYPRLELLFGANDPADPALKVIYHLQHEYPDVRSRVIVDRRRQGINPKASNLINIEPWAAYDHFVISDSNVRVAPNYLRRLAAAMHDPKVGLVTSMIRGVGAATIGAALDNLYLNTNVAGSVATTRRLFDVTITVGKSMLIRRDTLAKVGGFTAFRDVLLEDQILGQAVDRYGLKVVVSPCSVDNVNRTASIRGFVNRHIRWTTMRKRLNPGHHLAELLSHPTMLALIAVAVAPSSFTLGLLLLSAGAKAVLDTISSKLVDADLRWWMYLLLPVKDLMIAGIWVASCFGNTVTWRGRRYRVSKGAVAIPVPGRSDRQREPGG